VGDAKMHTRSQQGSSLLEYSFVLLFISLAAVTGASLIGKYSYQKGGWEVPDPDAYSISRPSGQFGKAPNMEQWSKFPRYQINDNFSIFLANHQMKFGFDYSYSPWYFYIESRQPGAFAFDTDAPFDPNNFSTYPYRFAYTVSEPG
jgi:hypothetical protein